MTAMWFGLAAIALAGAGALLYIDHTQRRQSGRVRQMWAKAQGFTFNAEDPNLPSTWHRAALAKQDYLSAVDIVSGVRRGEQFFLFDLEDTATIVAVRREVGSDVDLDIRLKSSPPPRDHDLELLGAMGDRAVFATDLEIARRVCDQRMVGFAEALPPKLQILWSEGFWTLGSLPVQTSSREWDEAIDAVTRFSGMLHVLPPPRDGRRGARGPGLTGGQHDPGRPHPAFDQDGPEAADVAPTPVPRRVEPRGPESRGPESRGPESQRPESQLSDDQRTDLPRRPAPTSRIQPPPERGSLPDRPGPERQAPQRPAPDRQGPPSAPRPRSVPDRLRTERPGPPSDSPRPESDRWGAVTPFPQRRPDIDRRPPTDSDDGPDLRL